VRRLEPDRNLEPTAHKFASFDSERILAPSLIYYLLAWLRQPEFDHEASSSDDLYLEKSHSLTGELTMKKAD
jgi:hypothetical protein